jgi:acylphosphatase
MTVIARHLIIKGHVQGVFYRAWTVETAMALGLTGWVRNRMGGDVEALVQGDPAIVARFIEAAWRGPSAARVEHVDEREAEPVQIGGFSQRETK